MANSQIKSLTSSGRNTNLVKFFSPYIDRTVCIEGIVVSWFDLSIETGKCFNSFAHKLIEGLSSIG